MTLGVLLQEFSDRSGVPVPQLDASAGTAVSANWFVQWKSFARSSCGTPSMFAVTVSGSSTAISLTKSHSPRSITASISRLVVRRMSSSRSATAREVKTFWRIPR